MGIKVGFIRKVYAIILAQIFLTMLGLLIPMYYEDAVYFLEDHWFLMIIAAAVAVVIELTLICAKKFARVAVVGYTLLFIFTFCEVYIIAFCAAYFSSQTMLIAYSLTAYVIAGLILYAAISGKNYSAFKAYLFMLFSSILLIAIIFMFKDLNDYARMVWCSVMVVIIGFYLIYDTQCIVKGKTH